jgi:TrmH family RNA methyltransferase
VREADRAFVAEGAKVLAAALDAGVAIEGLYVAPEGASNAAVSELVGRAVAAGVRVHQLGAGVMERVADTVTPQPVCGVVGYLDVPLERLLESDGLLLVCLEVRDPGNLGAVLRVADGMGCGGVLCGATTVDPYNPKVVRASAGSIFHVPLALARRPGEQDESLAALAGAGYSLLATAARGGADYAGVDLTGRVALLLGNEASGLPDEVAGAVDGLVTIPMEGRAESLNVAAAAAVIAAEASRQRRWPAAGPPLGGW